MKKLLPLILILVLLLSACSAAGESGESGQEAPASAVESDSGDHTLITFNGADVEIRGGGARDEGGAVTISAAGTYEVTGVSEGKMLVVDTGDDAMDVTLILNNVEIRNPSGPAIHVRQAKHFRLKLAEGSQNVLISGEESMLQNPDPEASGAALYSEDDMDIEGKGSLTIYGYLNNGIGCKNDLDFNSGTIAVLAANNGIRGNDSVQLKGSTVSVSAWGDGIKSSTLDKEGKGFVEVTGGTVTIESWGDGIQAATELHVTGGTLTVTTRGDGVDSSSKALKAQDYLKISGGTVTLNTQDDALRCVDGSVEITGGRLDILALSDGVRAGEKGSGVGGVKITGGEIHISAGNQAVKAEGSFSVSGCTLVALCGSEKQSAPAAGACLLCLITGAAGDEVKVGDVGVVEARQSYKCLLLISSRLSSGQQLTVSNRVGSVEATVR